MSLNSIISPTPTLAVPPQNISLMQHILSSKPNTWVPSHEWLSSPEISLHLPLWSVTLTQWKTAWMQCKTDRREAEDAMLKKEHAAKALQEHGSENPYAWPGLAVEAMEGAAEISAPNVRVVYEHVETLATLCGKDVLPSSQENAQVHVPVPTSQITTHIQQSDNQTNLSLLLAAGHTAQRRRGKAHQAQVPLPVAEKSTPASVNATDTRARHVDDGSFVVHNVRRFSICRFDEVVGYDDTLLNDQGSMWGRFVRRMRV